MSLIDEVKLGDRRAFIQILEVSERRKGDLPRKVLQMRLGVNGFARKFQRKESQRQIKSQLSRTRAPVFVENAFLQTLQRPLQRETSI